MVVEVGLMVCLRLRFVVVVIELVFVTVAVVGWSLRNCFVIICLLIYHNFHSYFCMLLAVRYCCCSPAVDNCASLIVIRETRFYVH